MGKTTREEARQNAEREACRKAVDAGADEQTLEVIDVMDVPLAYLPGNAVRYYLKVVGDLVESRKIPGEVFKPGIHTDVIRSHNPVLCRLLIVMNRIARMVSAGLSVKMFLSVIGLKKVVSL